MRDRCYSFCGTLMVCLVVIACGGGGSSNNPPGDGSSGGDHDADSDGSGAGSDAAVDGGSTFACDPIHQTGCGANQKCDLAANGNFGCVANGTLGDFHVCDETLPNACAAGFTCSGTFFDAHRCTQMCSQLESQCRTNEPCQREHSTADGKQFLTCVTHEECNPITDDCITPDTHCTYLVSISACRKSGAVADGAACQVRAGDTQDCAQGSACVGPNGSTKCVKLCDPGAANPTCPGGQVCALFTKVGPQDVGMCSPPP